MSCHKALGVITERAHYFHDCIYVHRASVRFEHSVCRGSLMTIYVMLLAELVEYSLVHWYQPVITIHDVPKCMSYHKAILVITGRTHCFHDCIYIMLICDICMLICINIYIYKKTFIFLKTIFLSNTFSLFVKALNSSISFEHLKLAQT